MIEGPSMATLHQFERSLDQRDTRQKYYALDLACAQLGPAGQPHKVRKIIAQRIIQAMEKGECDPARLCNIGLAGLGPVIAHPANQGFARDAHELFQKLCRAGRLSAVSAARVGPYSL
jgi:hypothetical protein